MMKSNGATFKMDPISTKDYPRPPFDHTKVSKENMNKMKAAFDANKKQSAEGEPKAKKAKKN